MKNEMKRSLYGKKMFVADLLLVSVWALMAWHFCIGRIVVPLMVLMRLSVAFELYRKSRWAFNGAVMFALAYVGCVFDMRSSELVFEPIKRIVYISACLVGDTENVVRMFQHYHSEELAVPLWIVWCLYSIWLVIMPIICSFNSKRFFAIYRHRPKILLFCASVLIFGCWMWIVDKDYSIIIFASLMSLSPLAYRLIYRQRRMSLIQELLSDRVLKAYIGLVLIFIAAVLTGLYNVNPAKLLLAIVAPIMLYVICSGLCKAKGVRTVPSIFYALTVISLFLTKCRQHEMVYILIGIGITSAVIASILGYRNIRSIWAVMFLIIADTFVLPLMLVGYNPYGAIEYDHADPFRDKYAVYNNGLYSIMDGDRKGLRDRYGVVVSPEYDRIFYLDNRHEYVVLCKTNGSNLIKDQQVKIYDLKNRRTIVDDEHNICRIEEIRNKTYALYDSDMNQRYSLVLPWSSTNIYVNDLMLIECMGTDTESSASDYGLPSDLKEAEKKIIDIYERTGSCGDALMSLVKSNYTTLSYPFVKLRESTNIGFNTSRDGKVRLYSWDTGMGGTSPDFVSYLQYESGDTVVADFFVPCGDSRYICEKDVRKDGYEVYDGFDINNIYQIDTSEGPAYIAVAYYRSSSAEGSQTAVAFRITDGKPTKIDFVTDGNKENRVEADYNIPDWYFTTDGLGWDWVMAFDDKTKTLYVPEHGDMDMSDRYELYRYEDGRMKYIGNDAGYWLHPSLHDFQRLCGIYQTSTKLIRIDRLKDGSYRFASWNKDNAMSGEPKLILHSGKTGIIENAILFKNGDYSYIVPEYRRGQGDDFGKFIIKHKDKVIQESDV